MHPRAVRMYKRIQENAWYNSIFIKEDVEQIANLLAECAEEGWWDWNEGMVEDGYAVVLNDLEEELIHPYDVAGLAELVERLHVRHTVFWALVNNPAVTWVRDQNRVFATPAVWSQIMRLDRRNGWYIGLGEPLWVELAMMFEGPDFHAFHDAADTDEEDGSGDESDAETDTEDDGSGEDSDDEE